jgi:hypothetical protein
MQTIDESTNTSDIEENSYVIREPTATYDVKLEIIFSKRILTILTILYIPFIILDFYYVNTDNSCIQQNTNYFIVLYDYLLVDAIYGISLLLFLPIILFIIDLDNEIEKQVFQVISLFRTFFILLWTSIAAYIFWGIMDNTKCDKNIYYYFYIGLIIRYIFGLLFMALNFEIVIV